jgi:ribose-phosphate pyrophosphokinase
MENLVVASPDVGGVKNARSFARRLERMQRASGAGDKVGFAIVDKHRKSPDEVAALSIIGDVEGKSVVIIDDIISTGGSLVEAAALLLERGAVEVVAVITHPILAGDAAEKVEKSRLEALFVTDTVPLREGIGGKIKVCSVAPLFGAAIDAINRNRSISKLFDGG